MWKREAKAAVMVTVSAICMAFNINTFVNAVGLYPGGFNGIALLVQRVGDSFWHVSLAFSLVSYPLNILALMVSFRDLGKRFIIYTCLSVGLCGLLTDIIPAFAVTSDVLLGSVFGGIINGVCISMAMLAGGSTGGLDILANVYGHRLNRDPWNITLAANCVILAAAGLLFGWDKALYSIIFQYASTQVIHLLYRKYQKATLFIISQQYEKIYQVIMEQTNHSATVLDGTGCYTNQEKKMIYSVVSGQEVKSLVRSIRRTDPAAFINIVKTTELDGRFIYKD
ncbi:MAG TPA: YitT family protein [Candidatus Scatomonas merdigallinarum]|nr:YitT family protein [Candidatus Scatomonas merdigallinarum]